MGGACTRPTGQASVLPRRPAAEKAAAAFGTSADGASPRRHDTRIERKESCVRESADTISRPISGEREAVDVVLRDGGTLRLRPPQAEDADALVDFFANLSERSLFLRFHGALTVDHALAEPYLGPDWV